MSIPVAVCLGLVIPFVSSSVLFQLLLLFNGGALQTVDVTQQWSIQCHELEKQIEELTHQLVAYASSGGTPSTNCTTGINRSDRPLLKARDSGSDEEMEELMPSEVKRKLEFGE